MPKKHNLSKVGLMQALGVVIYCGSVAGLMWFMGNSNIEPQGYLGSVLMLVLLVFSAAVCGSIIFGYPAYLVINKQVKGAIKVLLFTFLYCLVLVDIILMTIFIIL